MPRMLQEIVRQIVSGQPDLAIVGAFGYQDVATREIEPQRAAVVLTALGEPPQIDVGDLLFKHPHLRVLSLSTDGSKSVLSELRLYEQALGELSLAELLRVIRGTD